MTQNAGVSMMKTQKACFSMMKTQKTGIVVR